MFEELYRTLGHPLLAKLGPGGTDFPRFGMGQDCLWDSEEHSTADLLLVLVWDETASGTARSKTETRQLSSALLLLAVPEAASSHTITRSRNKLCS